MVGAGSARMEAAGEESGPVQEGRDAQDAAGVQEVPWGREDEPLNRMAREVMGQIEALRGLSFQRGVAARYADRATFLRYVDAMEAAMASPERRAAEPWIARLLGWVPADFDLRAAQREVLAAQVAGFYDPVRKTFFVMEGMHPDMVRLLMAHELAHALDDQHFDLLAKDRTLGDQTDALLAHHAVLEGCAQTVMTAWMGKHGGTLDPQALLEWQSQLDFEVLAKMPRYLWQPLFGLYAKGQAFLGALEPESTNGLAGAETLQKAFRDLPRSTEQVLHPAKYRQGETRDDPVQVSHGLAGLPPDWKPVHSDTLGELLVALCLQSQTRKVTLWSLPGLRYTHRGARGWGGDRISLLQRAEARLLVWDLVWDTPQDAQEFLDGLPEAAGPFGRILLRPEPKRLRWVAWSGSSREEALKVASQVQCSARGWGKIPASTPPAPATPSTPDAGGPPESPPSDRGPR